MTQIHNAGPPWSELEGDRELGGPGGRPRFGVGVIHPGVYSFIGGFHGKPNTGGPRDDPTGYIAPVRKEILDHNIVYEYQYGLVLGSLEEIRAQAVAARTDDSRPDYHFTRDRQHWSYRDASDAGFPIDGSWRIKLGAKSASLTGPEQWWRRRRDAKAFHPAPQQQNSPPADGCPVEHAGSPLRHRPAGRVHASARWSDAKL